MAIFMFSLNKRYYSLKVVHQSQLFYNGIPKKNRYWQDSKTLQYGFGMEFLERYNLFLGDMKPKLRVEDLVWMEISYIVDRRMPVLEFGILQHLHSYLKFLVMGFIKKESTVLLSMLIKN